MSVASVDERGGAWRRKAAQQGRSHLGQDRDRRGESNSEGENEKRDSARAFA